MGQRAKGSRVRSSAFGVRRKRRLKSERLVKKLVFATDKTGQLPTKPDKPAVAPAIQGFPFVNDHKGENNVRSCPCGSGTPGQAWLIYMNERFHTC